ncbi:agmatinase [Halogranum amylolyticum]|uniref:Agmatinase n=1 Tax=Halogranum amylolyticum TaxID=660520 RepID=A0A1H8NGJ6_9EURY|nr:arginase family protein [Halogranum amylolyticum]SEO28652.1 agmatinase [Halogranum amylolyticum]
MFPGATADRSDAAYVVVGAPLDVSTSFQPGTRFGPNRVRKYAETYDDYDRRTEQFFSELGVHDAGDVRAWDDTPAYVEWLRGTLTDVVWDDALPITVGGEHTVSAAGVAAVDPDVFVCLDAHLDLRDDYDGNPWSHASVTRRILDGWPDDGENDAGDGDAAGGADEATVLGARTGSPEEWERAEADDVTVVPPEEVADWTPDFDDDTSVYLSVDVDAADPGFAPGTGTMEPFGLAPRELRDVVRTVAPYTTGFDVVEVNDRDDGQAAALAGKLLREFVFSHAGHTAQS